MSFSAEQKREITLNKEKNACCRRATLLGALAVKGEANLDKVMLRVSDGDTIKYLKELIFEFYGKESTVSTLEKGGRCKVLSFDSRAAVKYIRNIDKNTYEFQKCTTCFAAFLRGIFLICGRVSEPSRQHSLEFSPRAERVDFLLEFFASLGLDFSVVTRCGNRSLYTKRSDTIEDFFGMAAMNNTFFKLVNMKINSESRNNANRVSNCETHNISKAVDAASKQVKLICELERRGLINLLPEELIETARLRIKNEDMSISQLALASNPPLSKSGLSHRLKRINEIAKHLIAGSEIL